MNLAMLRSKARRRLFLWAAFATVVLALIGGGTAVAVMDPAGAGVDPAGAGGTPLSRGKPVMASSIEYAGTPAWAAVDGDDSTRWSSAFSDPQWLQVDLGVDARISQVVLRWEAAYAKSFTIQVSPDAKAWTTIFGTFAGNGGTQTLDVTGSGRYVRLYGTSRATGYGYSLWEFEVYGEPAVANGCGTDNAALYRPATASSIENPSTPPSAAVDGSTGTRWSSAFSDPQWLQVDLGSSMSICRVVLRWEAAYASTFQIQVSEDARTWTTISVTTDGRGGPQTIFVAGAGRYVRMYGTARHTGYGYSLWEFVVNTATNPTTPGPSPSASPTATASPTGPPHTGGGGASPSATAPTRGGTTPATHGVLFDDFAYASPSDRAFTTLWSVRTGTGAPGQSGANWSASSVSFSGAGAATVMTMVASTDGTARGTRHSEVDSAATKYFLGTYAARVRFTDLPTGPAGAHVNETFFTISPDDGPDYSEQDFEYLPAGGWGDNRTKLTFTSWHSPSDSKEGSSVRSYEGWHTLVVQTTATSTTYYVDGVQQFFTSGGYVVREPQNICFNLWFIDGELGGVGATRSLRQDVDWVYFQSGQTLSPAAVAAQVDAQRAAGVTAINS